MASTGLTIVAVLLTLLSLVVFLSAILIPLAIALNIFGIRESFAKRFSSIPGFRSNKRWKMMLGTFGYCFLGFLILSSAGVALFPDVAEGEDNTVDASRSVPDAALNTPTVTSAAELDSEQSQQQKSQSEEPSEATATRSPTPSASPTATREPTPTESPTPTPTATPSPTPTPEPTPAPDGPSYAFRASGNAATETFYVEGGLVEFDLAHSGQSHFAIWLLNDRGEREELLVNTIGSWDGRVVMNLPEGDYLLDIAADGTWNANVRQPRYSTVEVKSLPQSMSDDDSNYIGPIYVDGLTRVSFVGQDDDHYGVWLLNHRGNNVDLLFNEIGPFEGSTAFGGEGVALIQVDTNGRWKMVIEDG